MCKRICLGEKTKCTQQWYMEGMDSIAVKKKKMNDLFKLVEVC